MPRVQATVACGASDPRTQFKEGRRPVQYNATLKAPMSSSQCDQVTVYSGRCVVLPLLLGFD